MARKDDFANKLDSATVTIANGAQLSGALDCGGMSLVGIITPAALTGTAMTLQGSHDNSTFNDVNNSAGTQVSITVAASRFIALNPDDFVSFRYLKLKSGSAEGAERIIRCVLRARS